MNFRRQNCDCFVLLGNVFVVLTAEIAFSSLSVLLNAACFGADFLARHCCTHLTFLQLAAFNGDKAWAANEDQLSTTHPIQGKVKDTDSTFLNFECVHCLLALRCLATDDPVFPCLFSCAFVCCDCIDVNRLAPRYPVASLVSSQLLIARLTRVGNVSLDRRQIRWQRRVCPEATGVRCQHGRFQARHATLLQEGTS